MFLFVYHGIDPKLFGLENVFDILHFLESSKQLKLRRFERVRVLGKAKILKWKVFMCYNRSTDQSKSNQNSIAYRHTLPHFHQSLISSTIYFLVKIFIIILKHLPFKQMPILPTISNNLQLKIQPR